MSLVWLSCAASTCIQQQSMRSAVILGLVHMLVIMQRYLLLVHLIRCTSALPRVADAGGLTLTSGGCFELQVVVAVQVEHLTRLARLSAEPLRWMRKLRGKVSALYESGVPLSSGTASGVPCTSGLAPGALRRLCAPADPSASPPDRLDALQASFLFYPRHHSAIPWS